jgi:hypothetical protein
MGEVELTAGARAILENLRDRRLLKYLFHEDPEVAGPYGYVDQPIDLETQHEIAETLAQKVLQGYHRTARQALKDTSNAE